MRIKAGEIKSVKVARYLTVYVLYNKSDLISHHVNIYNFIKRGHNCEWKTVKEAEGIP